MRLERQLNPLLDSVPSAPDCAKSGASPVHPCKEHRGRSSTLDERAHGFLVCRTSWMECEPIAYTAVATTGPVDLRRARGNPAFGCPWHGLRGYCRNLKHQIQEGFRLLTGTPVCDSAACDRPVLDRHLRALPVPTDPCYRSRSDGLGPGSSLSIAGLPHSERFFAQARPGRRGRGEDKRCALLRGGTQNHPAAWGARHRDIRRAFALLQPLGLHSSLHPRDRE